MTPIDPPVRRNDPELYEILADQWWQPRGAFAMLHWLAAARGALVPPAPRPGAVLVDLGCGAGLLAPHLVGKGYRHIGVDRSPSALRQACEHGVQGVLGDVLATPLSDGCADVVAAGEILEHVTDLPRAVAEACRLLRPGGLLVLDTLAATVLCRWVAIGIAERVPGLAPKGVHDPALLVDRALLVDECARSGVRVALRGIRPSMIDLLSWAFGRGSFVRMVPVASTAVLFQGCGRKEE
ncbi:bifunctional 3-demethylubiquinone 3-O-methyltransferase/2-octaprenyl-6-hydroxy phenol methylase [Nocardiopsis sp. TSRI0078]|uniref:methyltransferase domain-containing protein n=1 Tax=unclassified Nocardiopsis TaxID=2649073 RepID=UPI00093D319D|nr:methyltransferase domain-containing protein [Nocardiopsis sp. TSRI0078]OKI17063.1 bifunctional 3-demethylubiquinone 3-O-methyltransferase/2-octaprenyl-6-hydroxy phenol methylase [Nocardiopsis sp. TSRI0078]